MFETSHSVAGSIAGLFIYDLPLNYYGKLPEQIYAVTPKEVEVVSKKYFKPEAMIVVTVGDKNKIKPELEKLKLGPIIELDIDGNPIREAASLNSRQINRLRLLVNNDNRLSILTASNDTSVTTKITTKRKVLKTH